MKIRSQGILFDKGGKGVICYYYVVVMTPKLDILELCGMRRERVQINVIAPGGGDSSRKLKVFGRRSIDVF